MKKSKAFRLLCVTSFLCFSSRGSGKIDKKLYYNSLEGRIERISGVILFERNPHIYCDVMKRLGFPATGSRHGSSICSSGSKGPAQWPQDHWKFFFWCLLP